MFGDISARKFGWLIAWKNGGMVKTISSVSSIKTEEEKGQRRLQCELGTKGTEPRLNDNDNENGVGKEIGRDETNWEMLTRQERCAKNRQLAVWEALTKNGKANEITLN